MNEIESYFSAHLRARQVCGAPPHPGRHLVQPHWLVPLQAGGGICSREMLPGVQGRDALQGCQGGLWGTCGCGRRQRRGGCWAGGAGSRAGAAASGGRIVAAAAVQQSQHSPAARGPAAQTAGTPPLQIKIRASAVAVRTVRGKGNGKRGAGGAAILRHACQHSPSAPPHSPVRAQERLSSLHVCTTFSARLLRSSSCGAEGGREWYERLRVGARH